MAKWKVEGEDGEEREEREERKKWCGSGGGSVEG
jgi:hypothetical protein